MDIATIQYVRDVLHPGECPALILGDNNMFNSTSDKVGTKDEGNVCFIWDDTHELLHITRRNRRFDNILNMYVDDISYIQYGEIQLIRYDDVSEVQAETIRTNNNTVT